MTPRPALTCAIPYNRAGFVRECLAALAAACLLPQWAVRMLRRLKQGVAP